MDVLLKQERGACVPEIVEGDPGQARALQERCEGPLPKIGGVDEVPGLPGENEALILVNATGLQLLLCLPRPMTPKGFDGAGSEPDGPAALLRLRLTECSLLLCTLLPIRGHLGNRYTES